MLQFIVFNSERVPRISIALNTQINNDNNGTNNLVTTIYNLLKENILRINGTTHFHFFSI